MRDAAEGELDNGGNSEFITTPKEDVEDDRDDDDGGGGGVKNKGSVAKLLKFKLLLLDCDNMVVGVVGVVGDSCVIPAALVTIFGSDFVDLFPVVVVVEVLPHIEDNTKAAATVCSWL